MSFILTCLSQEKGKQNWKSSGPSDVSLPWDICQKIPMRWGIQIVKQMLRVWSNYIVFLTIYFNFRHCLMTPRCERWQVFSRTSNFSDLIVGGCGRDAAWVRNLHILINDCTCRSYLLFILHFYGVATHHQSLYHEFCIHESFIFIQS